MPVAGGRSTPEPAAPGAGRPADGACVWGQTGCGGWGGGGLPACPCRPACFVAAKQHLCLGSAGQANPCACCVAYLQLASADYTFKVEQYRLLAGAAAQQPRLAAGLAGSGLLALVLEDAKLLRSAGDFDSGLLVRLAWPCAAEPTLGCGWPWMAACLPCEVPAQQSQTLTA